jgi:hypothetical protein
MDKIGVFAACVGIVAFFLAIPMAILANLLTPKAKDYWALTTQSRREKRIHELELEIKACTRMLRPLVRQENFLRTVKWTVYAAAATLYTMSGIAFLIGIACWRFLRMHDYLIQGHSLKDVPPILFFCFYVSAASMAFAFLSLECPTTPKA